ncbi:MAG: glycosyl hydrolase 53 family protein, partial [Calditrichaeota bacterium]|nr:glycosyl hydrolase 53 family protein [Calditrichota bacterium]
SWQNYFPNHADIKSLHFDGGIPWPEAYNGEKFSQQLLSDWRLKRDILAPEAKIVLAMTPINFDRNGLASYWGAQGDNQPLPASWDQRSLDDSMVMVAYANYLLRAIEFFSPDYVVTGIEANMLVANNPSQWSAYLKLQQHVYTVIKRSYPELPVVVSLYYDYLQGGNGISKEQQEQALQDIAPYLDVIGISLYPYELVLNSDSVESIYTVLEDRIQPMLQLQKPIAITESGVPDREFTTNNTQYTFTQENQRDFVSAMLQLAMLHEFKFVINYAAIDYDKMLMYYSPETQDIAKIWAWTGLAKSGGQTKPALQVWDQYFTSK